MSINPFNHKDPSLLRAPRFIGVPPLPEAAIITWQEVIRINHLCMWSLDGNRVRGNCCKHVEGLTDTSRISMRLSCTLPEMLCRYLMVYSSHSSSAADVRASVHWTPTHLTHGWVMVSDNMDFCQSNLYHVIKPDFDRNSPWQINFPWSKYDKI